MNDFFIFNEIRSTDKNIVLLDYTTSFLPASNINFIEIPGRDGSISTGKREKQDIIINCEVAFIGETQDIFNNNSWLLGKGKLQFYDMLDKYYIGEVIEDLNFRNTEKWKEFNINFRCDPIKYGEKVIVNIENDVILYNSGTYKTRGIITIEITEEVNFLEIILQNTGQSIYLEDTFQIGDIIKIDLNEEHVYKNDYSFMQNLYLESDFFDIPPGEFRITKSSGNATLEFIERWI